MEKMYSLTENLKELIGELSISTAIITYIIGLFSLTALGSPIFILCSYIGTTLLLTGILTKIGILPTKLKSRNGASVILLMISALTITSAVLVFFTDIRITYTQTTSRPMTTPPSNTNAVDYFDLPGPELYKLGGTNVTLRRPYIWLFHPLLIIGGLLFIIALAIQLIP